MVSKNFHLNEQALVTRKRLPTYPATVYMFDPLAS